MKRLLAIIIAIALCVIPLSACGDNVASDEYKITKRAEDFTYYKDYPMNSERNLKVFGAIEKLNKHQILVGEAIQGLFARDGITYFFGGDEQTSYWLGTLKSDYGLTSQDVTLESMIADYKLKFSDNGFILYDYASNPYSINIATTIAGVTGYLPIDISMIEFATANGLTQKLDVSEKTQKWCFDTYKNELDNSVLVQQNYEHPHLRDYAIANKYLCFYEDRTTTKAIEYRKNIHSWGKSDAPIFGWGPGVEDSHVGLASTSSQFTMPSDFCYNITTFSAKSFYGADIIRPNKSSNKIVGEAGKHYVSVVRSDGDNIQTWFNYFPFSNKDMGAKRSDFPMGWSIQPSLADIAPTIINDVYKKADKNDNFVCAVSGMGYMYPKQFPKIGDFMGSLDTYLKRADLSIVQILDSGAYEDIIEWYSRVPSLKAGIYMYGEKYSGGHGSVYWSKNGKPFVSFRDTLWDTTGESMANKINNYPRNYKDISGYSLINLHPWSCDYNDVVKMVESLDKDIVVVSPDDFMNLIIENVPKVNKALLD